MVLLLVTSKPHKMAVNWVGPGKKICVISDTNYTVEIPGKRNSETIYHVNLLKPYHQRPEYVNLVFEENCEEVEKEAYIPYPVSDSTQMDFWKIVGDSSLAERVTTEELKNFHKLIMKYQDVSSSDLGVRRST